jgi:Ion channel
MMPSRRARTRTMVRGAVDPQYNFSVVLLLILTALVFQIAAPEGEGSRLVTIVLHGAALIAALAATHARPALVRLAAVAVAVALIVSAVTLVGPGEVTEAPAGIVNLLFIAFTPAVLALGLIRELRTERTVTVRTMFGVLCIYLLVGSFFAFMYGVIDVLGDHSFFQEEAGATTSDFLYYSFTVLTTTGIGDLSTSSELGRGLTIAEALIGQIYLVTVVALIVANLGRGTARQRG